MVLYDNVIKILKNNFIFIFSDAGMQNLADELQLE